LAFRSHFGGPRPDKLIGHPKNSGAEVSSEDGETEESDQDLDDDGWEPESDDDS
jgi:hypothetical protein